MSEIDWSKAPEGATHCLPEQNRRNIWRRRCPDNHQAWEAWVDGEWITVAPCVRSEGYIARQEAWSGEGLPPAGAVCEIAASTPYLSIRHPVGARVKVYANFTDDRGIELAAFVDEAGKVAGVCTARCFRPIRTPEQIAADERKAKIFDLADELSSYQDHEDPSEKHFRLATYLIDQGYSKQVAP